MCFFPLAHLGTPLPSQSVFLFFKYAPLILVLCLFEILFPGELIFCLFVVIFVPLPQR